LSDKGQEDAVKQCTCVLPTESLANTFVERFFFLSFYYPRGIRTVPHDAINMKDNTKAGALGFFMTNHVNKEENSRDPTYQSWEV